MPREVLEINSAQMFGELLKMDRVVLIVQADWSGPALVSRTLVIAMLNEMDTKLPAFRIESPVESNQFLIDWLTNQRKDSIEILLGGWGETLYMKKGVLIDFIKYPAHIGTEAVKKKLREWEIDK